MMTQTARPASRHIAAALCAGLLAMFPAMSGAQDAATLSGVALDVADDNRFFTRTGGTLRDTLSFQGLVPGRLYTLATHLVNLTTNEQSGDVVTTVFTPGEPDGEVRIELPMQPNRTDFNIDLLVVSRIYEGEMDAAALAAADPVAALEDAQADGRVVQLHAVQGISVTARDAADGDQQLPSDGGTIIATVTHVNLVEGYDYTVWGQLLTPSGQTSGIYASVAQYTPVEKQGYLELSFEVPAGFDGLKLIPAVGLYHKKRVTLREDGSIEWLENAPAPIMIASGVSLEAPEQTIRIGVPFEEE